ncbi:TPA: cell division protein FtsH [bacterium]|nr:cell division protein FtsH [bacterium]
MSKSMSRIALVFLIILIIITIYLPTQMRRQVEVKEIPYSQFLDYVSDPVVNLDKVKIVNRHITGIKKTAGKKDIKFKTYIPYEDPNLISLLYRNGIIFEGKEPDPQWWIAVVSNALLFILMIIIFYFIFFRHIQGPSSRAFTFGKSRARLLTEDRTKVTFEDVAGVDEAKEELAEIIDFLKDPKKFQRLGARIPKGVLLVGPPGTGKTLLAKAVAGEAGVHFFSISGSDFVEMFVGVGASRVRDLFEQSAKSAPCIVFIDEIDAVGRMRGAGLGGGHDEREQTLNQLLVEMDGFNTQEGVIIIAATNRPDILDPALLRPGRFDRVVVVDAPDLIGREEILRVHMKNKILDKKADVKVIARRTPGFVGSDLANLINEAAILASRRNKDQIELAELEEAIDRVIAGPERKSRLISEREKKMVAYHESGHALVARLIPGTDPVHKISIMPRGHTALGYTLQLPLEDRYLTTKSEILNKMTVLLGGRVAEELIFNEISTGAQNDLEQATEAARKMVCEYGMSETMGPLTFGRKESQVFLGRDIVKERNYSEEVASGIDREIRTIVESSYNRAKELLKKNQESLDLLSAALIEREVLEQTEIEEVLTKKDL